MNQIKQWTTVMGIKLKVDTEGDFPLMEGWAGVRYFNDDPRHPDFITKKFDAVIRAPLSVHEIEDLAVQNLLYGQNVVAIYFNEADYDFLVKTEEEVYTPVQPPADPVMAKLVKDLEDGMYNGPPQQPLQIVGLDEK